MFATVHFGEPEGEMTMFGAETLDHIAFPVRDLPRSEKFYQETIGLKFHKQRKNADGAPRHTYVPAGESEAPRYGIALDSDASFARAAKEIKANGLFCGEIVEHPADSFRLRSLTFIDP